MSVMILRDIDVDQQEKKVIADVANYENHENEVLRKVVDVHNQKETKQLEALKTLVTEKERVKKYGFTQGELDRAKSQVISYMESTYNERDKTERSHYVQESQLNFLKNEPMPGIEWTNSTMQKLL